MSSKNLRHRWTHSERDFIINQGQILPENRENFDSFRLASKNNSEPIKNNDFFTLRWEYVSFMLIGAITTIIIVCLLFLMYFFCVKEKFML